MSELPDPIVAPEPEWPKLDPVARRVLGVLVEKAKTTPDAYPMTLNGLLAGSNQKSNRDPVLSLDEGQVEEALEALQKALLVIRITGSGRVDKWRHNLYEAWRVEKVELAILAELLLRGTQTEGELRTRTSRMEPIEDLDALRNALKPLRDRKLIVYVTPEGRRGTLLTHGFLLPGELDRLRARLGTTDTHEEEPAGTAVREDRPGLEKRLEQAEGAIAELKTALADVQNRLAQLTATTKSEPGL